MQAMTATASVVEHAYLEDGLDAARQNALRRAFHCEMARASLNPLLAEMMTSVTDAFAASLDLRHTCPTRRR